MVFAMVHRGYGRHGPGWGGPPGRRGARCRWRLDADEHGPGEWVVHARVERFVEPALLLTLRDGESHGYDLADALARIAPDERVDLGNLYRLLRALEEEGVVTSRWRDDLPGRAKRTYELTDAGRTLLDTWADALGRVDQTIHAFVERYEKGVSP